MELITTPCADNANSYANIEDFDTYIAQRDGFDPESWMSLTEHQKTLRMIYGAFVVDSLNFKGRKACKNQTLKFPRIMPGGLLYDAGSSFMDYDSLKEFSELMQEPVPVVPENVKLAQIEATFQIIHSHLFNIEAFESGESAIASLSIDVIHMTFEKESGSPYSVFTKTDFGAASTIKLLLQPFISNLRIALI